jgi:hypothetical protein
MPGVRDGTVEECVFSPCVGVKKLPAEDEIKARLRELTAETRRVREELQGLIRRNPGRTSAFTHDRPDKLKRRKTS